jgi:nucleoside-diphosphate-sugar epimerase
VAGTQHSSSALLLGASGKLGRMMRAVWRPQDYIVLPVFRNIPAGQGVVQWFPGAPPPDLARVRAVVALWGVTPGADRVLEDNVRLAEAAMDLAEQVKAEVVVHCSSAAVYRPGVQAIAESVQPDPQSAYGRAKVSMEQAIVRRCHAEGPRQIVLRIGNVAGADGLFANLRPGRRMVLDQFENGQGPARSYIAPHDLARCIEALIASPTAEGVFNVAAPMPTAMADLINACGEDLCWREAPEAAFPMMWLDTKRLTQMVPMDAATAGASYLVNAAKNTGVWP